jgi:hypothetical protein
MLPQVLIPMVTSHHPLQPINSTHSNFEPAPYIVSPVVERYHKTWRFGHSNNFTQFVIGVLKEDASGASDYAEG